MLQTIFQVLFFIIVMAIFLVILIAAGMALMGGLKAEDTQIDENNDEP